VFPRRTTSSKSLHKGATLPIGGLLYPPFNGEKRRFGGLSPEVTGLPPDPTQRSSSSRVCVSTHHRSGAFTRLRHRSLPPLYLLPLLQRCVCRISISHRWSSPAAKSMKTTTLRRRCTTCDWQRRVEVWRAVTAVRSSPHVGRLPATLRRLGRRLGLRFGLSVYATGATTAPVVPVLGVFRVYPWRRRTYATSNTLNNPPHVA